MKSEKGLANSNGVAALVRQRIKILVVAIVLLFFLATQSEQATSIKKASFPALLKAYEQASSRLRTGSPRRIVLIETNSCHDEVWASFLHTIGAKKANNRVTLFIKKRRFGIDAMFEHLQWKHQPKMFNHKAFTVSKIKAIDPHVLVSITCDHDLRTNHAEFQKIFLETKTVLYCVMHHAAALKDNLRHAQTARYLEPWMNAGRVRLITLSPHVTIGLRQGLMSSMQVSQQVTLPISTLVPVFELPPSMYEAAHKRRRSPYIVLQGLFEAKRRDYDGIFNIFRKKAGRLASSSGSDDQQSPVKLKLLGNGDPPSIPEDMQDLVEVLRGLSYRDFYTTLAGSLVLIPGFSTDDYYTDKASSTVAASLITGTPLIASKRMLSSYSFLSEDEVFMAKPGEDEIQAAMRAASAPPKVLARLSASLLNKQKRLSQANRRLFGEMVWMDTGSRP